MTFMILTFFVLGAVVGSFLNSLVFRYSTGLFSKKRSICFTCGKELTWKELVPIVSYYNLKGRCAHCKSKISIQYPLVEFATGLLFSAVYIKAGISVETLLTLLVVALLIAITVYDIRHKIIPNGLVYLFIFISFGLMFVNQNNLGFDQLSTLDILAGPIIFLFFFSLWYISKGQWMGFGDGKLGLGLGWFLGIEQSITAVIISFWVGALVSILLVLFQNSWGKRKLNKGSKRLTMKSEVPFAPFMVLGLFVVYFFSISLFWIG